MKTGVKIFIAGNVPSSKNSKRWTGKYLIMSKTVQKYLKAYGYLWSDPQTKNIFKNGLKNITPPYKIYFTFVRGTKHIFDYINAAQLPLDLMVKHGWIEDDNANIVIPVFNSYQYDKENPGVLIELKN